MDKVTFDGPNRLIIINSGVTDINVKDDIYLPWKAWVLSGGSMYYAALRTSGGDPTSTNQNAPTYYFLINNWKIKAEDVSVIIKENLYSDDYDNPFINTNSSIILKNSDIPGVESLSTQMTGITSQITIIDTQISGLTNDVSDLNYYVSGLTNEVSILNSEISDLSIDIKLILGLSQHNYRLFNHVYDSGQRLTSVLIKLYNSGSDCDSDLNSFAQYQMNASYNSEGLLIDYKVVKI